MSTIEEHDCKWFRCLTKGLTFANVSVGVARMKLAYLICATASNKQLPISISRYDLQKPSNRGLMLSGARLFVLHEDHVMVAYYGFTQCFNSHGQCIYVRTSTEWTVMAQNGDRVLLRHLAKTMSWPLHTAVMWRTRMKYCIEAI
jgi:hypothetical protein